METRPAIVAGYLLLLLLTGSSCLPSSVNLRQAALEAWTSRVTGRVSNQAYSSSTPNELFQSTTVSRRQLTDTPSEPYVAFNIWSYEGDQLKLSAVKKIPAREVLGYDFYNNVTQNNTESVMVLANSFLVDQDNSQLSNYGAVDAIEVNNAEANQAPNQNAPQEVFKPEQELLNTIAATLPPPIASPISNVYDLVSYVMKDGTPATEVKTESLPHATDNDENKMTQEEETNAVITDANEESQYPPVDSLFTEEPQPGYGLPSLSNVLITPGGFSIDQDAGNNPNTNAIQQLIERIQGQALTFNINQTSASPHKIQVSLINEEGIPTDPSLLPNANLISIISNKPTVINHNVYHIMKDGSIHGGPVTTPKDEAKPELDSSPLPEPEFDSSPLPEPEFDSSPLPKPEVVNSPLPPPPSFSSFLGPVLQPPTFINSFIPSNILSSPELELLKELESINSFNNIVNGLTVEKIHNPITVQSFALTGILNTEPNLVNLVSESNGPIIHEEHINTGFPPLKLDDFRVPPSNEFFLSPEPPLSDDKEKTELNILEKLLKNNELPKTVEVAILTDILSGSTISDAIMKNLAKYRDEIDSHNTKYTEPSPLFVVDNLENIRPPSSNSPKAPAQDTPTVNVKAADSAAPPPAVVLRANAATSLENCFKDTACAFALSLAIATYTTGIFTVPFLTPVFGRSVRFANPADIKQHSNELMNIDDAEKIVAALTKYTDRNGRSYRDPQRNLRDYMMPYIKYLSHKLFPKIFGYLPSENGR